MSYCFCFFNCRHDFNMFMHLRATVEIGFRYRQIFEGASWTWDLLVKLLAQFQNVPHFRVRMIVTSFYTHQLSLHSAPITKFPAFSSRPITIVFPVSASYGLPALLHPVLHQEQSFPMNHHQHQGCKIIQTYPTSWTLINLDLHFYLSLLNCTKKTLFQDGESWMESKTGSKDKEFQKIRNVR